jgi:hypothetical protein
MPKKRRKNSCISGSSMPPCPWAFWRTRSVVRIFTTAGPVRSTISAKSGRAATVGEATGGAATTAGAAAKTEAASKAPARVFFMGVIATVFYLDFSSMELAT